MQQNNNPNAFQQPIQPPPTQMPNQMKTVMPIQIRKTKSKFLTFCCALMPGAGQMYHGLLKKGLSIMLIFWGIIALSVLLYVPVINFALPIVWFYSFFDAVNRMNATVDELRLIKDEFIFAVDMPKGETFKNVLKKRHLWIGWGLTIIGGYSILRVVADRFYYYGNYFSDNIYRAIRQVLDVLPTMIVPIACIFIGLKLLKTSSKKKEINYTPHNLTEE